MLKEVVRIRKLMGFIVKERLITVVFAIQDLTLIY